MGAFTVINQNLAGFDPTLIAGSLFGTGTGISFDPSSFALIAGENSAAMYDGSLGLGVGAGLLLTSGTLPGTANTLGYFGQDNGMAGDAMLDTVVNAVFPTVSYDATVLSFDFTVSDATIQGVSFNIVFGSDEFPEWVDKFVDIAAVWVNGVDYAYFNNQTSAPLSVIGSNLASNYFINNTGNLTTSSFGGVAKPGVASTLPIEYDGVSAPLTIFAPVHQGLNMLRIGIADTGDHIYDSGLFISGMAGTSLPVRGITLDRDGTQGNDDLIGTQTPELLRGMDGDDDISGAGGDDVMQAGNGNDFISGGLGNDNIDGGAGTDTANFSGNAADYAITAQADGSYLVTDLRAGAPDGADTLINVENVQFADITLDLATGKEVARVIAPIGTVPLALPPAPPPAIALPDSISVLNESATEDDAVVSADALHGIAPSGSGLFVTNLPEALPAGVTFNAFTHAFFLDPSDAAFQSLAVGEQMVVSIAYGITDGTNTTPTSVVFTVTGTNDAPVVSGPATASVLEGDGVVSVNALANATDVDHGAVLAVVAAPEPDVAGGAPVASSPHGHGANDAAPNASSVSALGVAGLPSGVSYDAATGMFSLDASDPAYQALSAGQTQTVSVNYGVSDGTETTAASVVFTVTGTNDAPVVSGPVGLSAVEGSGNVLLDHAALLANATDIDAGDTLAIEIDPAALPANVIYQHTPGSTVTVTVTVQSYYGVPVGTYTTEVPATDTLSLDTSSPDYDSLAEGEVLDVVVPYVITDGVARVQSEAVFHVVGRNDAPVVAGTVVVAATEGTGVTKANALANASDVDHNAVLSVAALPVAGKVENVLSGHGVVEAAALPVPILAFDPAGLPAGVSFDASTNSFAIDANAPAYAVLGAGQTTTVTVNYGISDGIVVTPASMVFTLTGVNNAPVVNGPVDSLFVNEDGAGGSYDIAALLSTTHDADTGDTLSVTLDASNLPDGVSFVTTPEHVIPGYTIPAHVIPAGPRGTSWGAYVYPAQYVPAVVVPDQVVPATTTLSIDPSNAAFQGLAQGEELQVVVNYLVSDGAVSVPAQAIFTVNGMNDAPVISAPGHAVVAEDGAAATIDGLANASDADHGSVLSLVAAPVPVAPSIPTGDSATDIAEAQALAAAAAPEIMVFDPAVLPAGVSYDEATHSFSIDPANAAFQSLAAGQTLDVTVDYGVTDGITVTAAQAVFTVTGTNDAPVVSGPVEATAVEDQQSGVILGAELLAVAYDPDATDQLTQVIDTTNLPAGVSYIGTPSVAQVVHRTYYGVTYTGVETVDTLRLQLDTSDAAYQSLAEGEKLDVVVNYKVSDGTVATDAQAIFHVTGTNDAPVVAGTVAALAIEGGAAVSVSGLAAASDVDHGAVLSVVAVPGAPIGETSISHAGIIESVPIAASILPLDPAGLPAGVSFDAASNSFSFDPTNAAYRYLSQGQTADVVVNYGITDGIVAVAASAVFTVTGTNQAPVVSGPVRLTVTEDGASAGFKGTALITDATAASLASDVHTGGVVADMLANATDIDQHDVLSVVNVAALPAGVSLSSVPGGYYMPPISAYAIDPGNAAFQSLAQGETMEVVIDYGVSDGVETTAAQAIFTVVGTNDAPVVATPASATANEDGAVARLDALATATDVDNGAVLSVVGVPAVLPAGVSYDAASHSFSIDPTNAAYQALSAGQVQQVSIAYGVTDGMVTTAASAVFNVVGTNDVPIVAAPLAMAVSEDAAPVLLNLVAGASDIDLADTLVAVLPSVLPAGFHQTQVSGGYYQPPVLVNTFNATDATFQSLAAGETMSVRLDYQVSDGHALVATHMDVTVTGVNDAPVIAAPAAIVVTEDAAVARIDALANASDIDHGAVLSVVNVGLLPAGISFDAATHSFAIDPTAAPFQALQQGEVHTWSVAYGVSDGIVTTATTANFTVIGVNDAPVVSGPATGSAIEDGNTVSVNALGNTSDADTSGPAMRITGVPANLPAGVSYDAVGRRFLLDPSNAAYQSLSKGQSATVTVGYNVSDGYVEVPTSVVFTVTGTNDAPVVAGTVNGGTTTGQGAPVALNLLARTTDIDAQDTVNVNLAGGAKVTASVMSGTWAAPVAFTVANNVLTLDPTQFASLGFGNTVGLNFAFQVTDGNPGGTAAANATLTIQGTNKGPTGVTMTDVTGSLAKAQTGSGINAKTAVASFTETGGVAADTYSYTLGGAGAAGFTLGTAGGVATLSSGSSPVVGAAGGKLYALGITATDTTAGISAPVAAVDVVVGQGSGNGTINLASLPSMVPSTPTFIYDLGGSDQINGAGMTGKLWIDGGQGADVMTGGSGANVFLYGATTDSTAAAMDIITNFHAATDLIDFTGLGGKALAVTALAASATSLAGNTIGYQASGGNSFIYVNTTGNSQTLVSSAMKIELLGNQSLTGSNFAHL